MQHLATDAGHDATAGADAELQVKCGTCQRSELVAFSCKQRGLCPSCGTRRAHETAAHCGEVLPEVAYRQRTLSASYRVRWALVKHPGLLAKMERRLVRAVWGWQRRSAKRLGTEGKLHGGAVGFRQYFGSALQLHLTRLQGCSRRTRS